MNTFVKSLVVAAALFAGANSITAASSADASRMACQNGQLTVHGVWDCR